MTPQQEPKYGINGAGQIINRSTGVPIPEDEPVMVFRAKDRKAVVALEAYSAACADPHQRAVVASRIGDFRRFASHNADRMKEPDTGRTFTPITEKELPQGIGFGGALDALEQGHKVCRAGWNGKGMWLLLQRPHAHSKMTLPYAFIEYPVGHSAFPQGCRVPWLPSQTDMMAKDWMVLP